MLRSFYEERGLKNRQNLSSELGKLSSMSVQIIDLDCGSGHRSFELFLVLSAAAVQHFTSFAFFLLLYFSPLQEHCSNTEERWTT